MNLVWIDLEMTGLDPERNVIIEIASLTWKADQPGPVTRRLQVAYREYVVSAVGTGTY